MSRKLCKPFVVAGLEQFEKQDVTGLYLFVVPLKHNGNSEQ